MSAVSDIIGALSSAGLPLAVMAHAGKQGAMATVPGHGKPVRVYAWEVSDNGMATGVLQPADERRI